jgi:BASS family bile acid:Na+ symporter
MSFRQSLTAEATMQASLITTVLLPMALGIIMFGLGLHLRIADFARVLRMPRPVVIGLAAQMLVLPPIAFALCLVFALPAPLAIGLMLLVASPGGATANVFSHLAKGDVALNITLTAINSLLALITLPLIVQWSMQHFLGSEASVPPPVQKIVEVGAIILVPVAFGMLMRARTPALADRLERLVKPLSLAILVGLIVLSVVKERDMMRAHAASVAGVCLMLNLLSLGVGYGCARLAKIERRQAIAIAFEIGIHNSTLAIFIALNVLGQSAFSIPAAIYSLVMYFTAAAMVWWFRRTQT